VQPHVDYSVLVGGHFSKLYTDAKDAQAAAGLRVA
jgi:hypothetical protein